MQTITPDFFSSHFNDIGSAQLVWLTCLRQLRQAAGRTTTWPCALCSQCDHVKIQDHFCDENDTNKAAMSGLQSAA